MAASKEEARTAIDEFVDAFSSQDESTRSYLSELGGPFQEAFKFVGDKFGGGAIDSEPIYSGLPAAQKDLVNLNLNQVASEFVEKTVEENVGNKINRIMEEARAAEFHLFEVGPEYFYKMITRNSQRLNRAISQCLASSAALAAAAVTYNTLHQTLDRSNLDDIDAATVDQVRQDTITALARVELAITEANDTQNIKAATVTEACAALAATCTFLTNPDAIVLFLSMEQVLKRISDTERAVNEVIKRKNDFEKAFNNTLNANFINPIRRTYNTVSTELGDLVEKLDVLLAQPNFNKFNATDILLDLCQRTQIFCQSFLQSPENVKVEISTDLNFSTFEQATIDIAAETNGPAEDFLAFTPTYRQVVQSAIPTDLRPALDDRTTELLSKIGALDAWLAAQAAILVALPTLVSEAADIGLDILGVSSLDRSNDLAQGNNMGELANQKANTASKAGDAADKIGCVLAELPVSEADKFGALSDVRNDLLAVEQTQAFASEAIINETPAAIAEVDTQTRRVASIKERSEVLLA